MIAGHLHSAANQDPQEEYGSTEKRTPPASTERVRLCRERRRRGLMPLTIEIYANEKDDLIAHGLLVADQREDRAAVAKALGRVLDRFFRDLRGSRPPQA